MIYLSGVVRPDFPAMLTPDIPNRLVDGQVWAIDNGRYNRPDAYSDERYLATLAKRSPWLPTCLFATAPDVYGDAKATLALSAPMYDRIRKAGYPVALVAQPELTVAEIPWDAIDALFVGGPWRGSERAYALSDEARARGKWTHLGRVNSGRMLLAAQSAGIDSADGTFLRWGRDGNVPRLRKWLADAERSIWRGVA